MHRFCSAQAQLLGDISLGYGELTNVQSWAMSDSTALREQLLSLKKSSAEKDATIKRYVQVSHTDLHVLACVLWPAMLCMGRYSQQSPAVAGQTGSTPSSVTHSLACMPRGTTAC